MIELEDITNYTGVFSTDPHKFIKIYSFADVILLRGKFKRLKDFRAWEYLAPNNADGSPVNHPHKFPLYVCVDHHSFDGYSFTYMYVPKEEYEHNYQVFDILEIIDEIPSLNLVITQLRREIAGA